MGCSEFYIVHDLHFSITPSNWFDARACCKRLGNWSHKFDLVNFENNSLEDYQLEYVMSAYQTFNHGFWTSGSNYGGRSRLFWYTGNYPLITDSNLFYQRYMEAYDPLPEDDQCIQGHFDEDRNKFQFSHSNCYNMKKFICVRAPRKKKRTWPVDCESVGYHQLNNSNYFVALHGMPFARAAECCRRRQAVMVTIDSAMLNDYLYKLITKEEGIIYDSPSKLKWIGLTRNPVNQEYSWLRDGKILRRGRDFSNFDNRSDLHFTDTYYPGEMIQSCVGVYVQDEPGLKKLFWRPLPCTLGLSSLCYRRMRPDDASVMRRGRNPIVRKTYTPAFDKMIEALKEPKKFGLLITNGTYRNMTFWEKVLLAV
ncbi:unnamed protein product [Orchesella dallaii]|uniref:C-type lectin domain-containing protein n=1 Tax=Orchesella dallaii TaxID=48710 RepID=A0ABP1R8M9_9HEXA